MVGSGGGWGLAMLAALALGGCKSAAIDDKAAATREPHKPQILHATLTPMARVSLAERARTHDPVIVLTRQPCYGLCPVYTVTVHHDGAVTYQGERYVRTRGKATSTISVEAVDALIARLDDAGVLDMHWTSCPGVTDQDTVNLTFHHDGRRNSVSHYRGDGCAPKDLGALEDEIDRVAGTRKWVACAGPDGICDR